MLRKVTENVQKDEQVRTNYFDLKKQGYIPVFLSLAEDFPENFESISCDYKLGELINKSVQIFGMDYEEKSIWIKPNDKDLFYENNFPNLLVHLHGDNSLIILFILRELDQLGFSWEAQETLYKYRFYEISKNGLTFNLMVNHKFEKVTIWNKQFTKEIIISDGWKKDFPVFLGQLDVN